MTRTPAALVLICAAFAVHSAAPCDARYCAFTDGPCVVQAGSATVTLDITPKPVAAMKELFFSVSLRGISAPPSLLLSLSMPGMYMGINEVMLTKAPDGTYRGRGLIPRCPAGRDLWQAELIIPGRTTAVYRFHVRY